MRHFRQTLDSIINEPLDGKVRAITSFGIWLASAAFIFSTISLYLGFDTSPRWDLSFGACVALLVKST